MSTPAKPEKSKSKRERQDWLIVLLILLLGFCCVLVAGQYALRFAPSWQVDTDMESNIDLNSEFLTGKPQEFFEPLDPAILTQPGWVNGNVFLTPGADFVTGTPATALASTSTVPPTVPGTVTAVTNTVAVTSTIVPTNTLVWIPLPATSTPRPPPPPADTPTSASPPSVDLHIAMNDAGVISYLPGDPVTYTIIVTSTSTFDVIGATVTDFLSAQITGASWSCVAAGGATCSPGGAGSINNDVVNIPATAGASLTYTISGTVSAFSVGPLSNTASVAAPVGIIESNGTDNIATDTNAGPNAGSGGQINIGPGDGVWDAQGAGTSIVMVVSPAIVVDGNGDDDLVFYERIAAAVPPAVPPATDPRVDLDVVRVRISSDGSTWYTVFYWGDGASDTNTNVALPVTGSAGTFCAAEIDNCQIPVGRLYNSTGITINVDIPGIPAGSYSWIEIYAPGAPADTDGAADIDAIQILP